MLPHTIGSRIAGGERRLNVGLMIDGCVVPRWAESVIRHIVDLPFVAVALVIMNDTDGQPAKASPNVSVKVLRRLRQAVRRWCYGGEPMPLGPAPGPHADERVDASAVLAGIPVLSVTVEQKVTGIAMDEADVGRVRNHQLDVLIQLGRDPWQGSILHAARLGVWSLMHGDRAVRRGDFAGTWEVIERNPVTVATLEILQDDPAENIVLHRSATATCLWSIRANWNLMRWHSAFFIPRSLAELWRDGESVFLGRQNGRRRDLAVDVRRSYVAPSRRELKEFRQHQRALIESEQRIETTMMRQWILLYDLGHDDLSTVMPRFKRLQPPADRVWADPFVVERDHRYFVFFEEHILARKHGHLSVLVMEPDGSMGEPEIILERPYHLSYPFVFEHGGEWFMIPETRGNHAVELYRCVEFPHRWIWHRTLLSQVEAVDATLWHDGTRWWMWVGMVDGCGAYTWTDLHLFYADDPVSGEWKAHKLNPVVTDVRCARSAGRLFRRDGKVYRPAQDGSVRYGYGIRLYEVIELSLDNYEEREVAFIKPGWAPDVYGVHTINQAGRLTVADARVLRPKTA